MPTPVARPGVSSGEGGPLLMSSTREGVGPLGRAARHDQPH